MTSHDGRYFEFRGVRIDDTNLTDISRKVTKGPSAKGYVCFNDVTNIVRAIKNPLMLEAVNGAFVSAPDGMPLVWFGKLLGGKRIGRVAGFDCLRHMLEENNGLRHFLLGDTTDTIERVIKKAKCKNPKVLIGGYSPPFKDEFDLADNEAIIQEINNFDPDVIWVSFGGGKQEKWMNENYHKINRGIMMGVGAAFKFYIGKLQIPPAIVQKTGLQWFYRMLSSPKKWFKNYALSKLIFVLYMPVEVFKGRIICLRSRWK